MSSPQPFMPSSPDHNGEGQGRRRKSRFNYRHLAQLATYSTSCPLRVIAHVDLDAFYAQCEMVRNNIPEDQPLAVQQWQGLIAINYPSRKFGLTRMISPTEAKKLCPHIILQHVATWKEGDEKWAYHADAAKHISTHKVSLDPYRLESRRILACIKETLPADLQKVEKAGIDEVFLDLSAQIHSIMLQRFPELAGPAPYDDPTELLPMPPSTALDWQADALVDLDAAEAEEDDPDWDDIATLIGSEIVRIVRATIRETLKYTCSGGIAQNKMIAKLGSAHKKPDQQTVIRNRAVQQFLSEYKFTKIRGLGGKLGDTLVSVFKAEMVKDLLPVSVEQLKQKINDDTGTWVYQILRGIDQSEVSSRTQIKSMLSAKSFRPDINTFEQATRWLRIFAADIFSRLVEEGVHENKRRPKTMNLHHRTGGVTKSRSAAISSGKKIEEIMLYELAKTLMGQIVQEGRVWPCNNISLSVAGFEDGVAGNMGIGAFLVKGEDAKALNYSSRESSITATVRDRPEKRRRIDAPAGIQKFFAKSDTVGEHDDDFGSQLPEANNDDTNEVTFPDSIKFDDGPDTNDLFTDDKVQDAQISTIPTVSSPLEQQSIRDFTCERCGAQLDIEDEQSHTDWHFAKDLQDGEHPTTSRPSPTTLTASKKTTQSSSKKKPAGRGKQEKGQTRLAFG